MVKCVLFVGVLAALVACQATSTPQPSVPAPTVLTGLVGAESDVTGRPNQPLVNQMVVAVPVAMAEAILGPGTQALVNQRLRFLKASLLKPDPAISIVLSDASGNYNLALAAGEYILCIADSETTPPGFPAITRGCGRTQVLPSQLKRVDISSSFGEIILIER